MEKNNDLISHILKEKIKPPQELVLLRKSTRERGNMISNDYVIFLKEHEAIIEMMENVTINLHQAI